MPQFRATFFFKDDNGYGWTETIHSTKGTLLATMDAARALVPLRTGCMGNTSSLTFVRVSDDLVKRDSKIFQVPDGNARNKPPDAGPSDIANTCLVVRIEADPLVRRTLYMRGIPDNIVVESGKFIGTPSFVPAFAAWAARLKLDSWAVKAKDPLAVPRTIGAIVQDPNTGNVTITTGVAHGFIQNDAVTIRGVTGATALNGSFSVFAVPTNTSFVLVVRSILAPWLGRGTATKNAFTLTGITEVLAMRASHRVSGRPFDSPRGRRPVRQRK